MKELPGNNRNDGLYLLGPEDEALAGHWLGTERHSASLGHLFLLLKRRGRLIIGFTMATFMVTALVVFFLLRPMYRATTNVLIQRNAPQVLDMQEELFSPDLLDTQHDFYKTQEDLLDSNLLAAQVIRKLDLQNNGKFLASYLGGLPGWLLDRSRGLYYLIFPPIKTPMQDNPLGVDPGLIKRYQSRLSVIPALNAQMMSISFLTPDPILSAKIANAHAQAYIDEGLKLRTDPGEQAEQFLHSKLAEIENRLRDSENKLNDYRRDHGLLYLNGGDGYDRAKPGAEGVRETTLLERIETLGKLLAQAETDRIAWQAQAQLVARHDYDALPEVVDSPLVQNLKEQLATLESQEAQIAATFTPAHPKYQRARAQTEEVRARLRREETNIAEGTNAAYLAAQAKDQNLQAEMDMLKEQAMKQNDARVEDTILAREVETNRELYQGVLQRMKEMGMEAQLRASNVSVIDPAIPPNEPAIPKKALSLMLSIIIGLIGGSGLALTFEYLDNTLETPAEVEAALRLPNLTVVPDFITMANGNGVGKLGNSNNGAETAAAGNGDGAKAIAAVASMRMPTLSETPFSAATEAFRTLCTGIVLSQPDHPPQAMLFTSTRKGEGKTVTVLNTAVAFAQAGRRVVVVDADLRRSQCHRVLGIENGAGLTETLTGQVEIGQVTRHVVEGQNNGGVWIVTSGSRPPNPGALIGSRRMQETIARLREQFDHVIIDTCPIVPMSDALILATLVDGVILVVQAGETPRNVVRDAVVHLARVRARMLGVVLNRVDMKNSDYAYYFYRHYSPYYGEAPQSEA